MNTTAPLELWRQTAAPRMTPRARRRAARSVQVLIAAGSLTLLYPTRLLSQDPGAVAGIITDLDDAPLSRARVTVVGTELVAHTRDDGRFHMGAIPPGARILEVRLLGYSMLRLPVDIKPGETVRLGLALTFEPVPLKGVDVKAGPMLPPELRDFQERRARGSGRFFTRHEIAQMQPRLFTDVLRRVPGVQLQSVSGPYGAGYVVHMSRNSGVMGARVCPVLFYVNGVPFPVAADHAINHFIAPEEVAALEVYASTSDVPPQFNSSMHNARCGVIVVWTYSGERRHPTSFR